MSTQRKTFQGIMNLDDSNDIFPSTHHKEARNGVFKGNAPDMHFTAIRGNSMVTNSSLIKNDCNFSGNIVFTPNCALSGTIALTTAVNFNILSVCDGIYQDVTINSITGGDGNYQASTTTYDTEFAALNGTFVAVVNGAKVYDNQPGTTARFVAVRDGSGTTPIVKSINSNCTTTSSTSSTTTLPQEWYYIYDCTSNTIVTSTNYVQGTFSVNQSVYSPATQRNYYIQSISSTALPSPNYPIQSIGGTGCQAITTTTTIPMVTYTFTTACPAGPGFGQIIVANADGGTYLNYYARIINISNGQVTTLGPFNQGSGVTFSNLPDSNYVLTVGIGTSLNYGSTKYPSIACGTTTTPPTTTQAPTTTPAPVNFGGSAGCANAGQSDGAITILSFTGGLGTYDATPSNITYSTEQAARDGDFTNVTFTRTYTELAAGTYWVAVRDRSNTFNKIAKSFTVGVCPTTTTTTLPPITASTSSVCTSSGTQNITVNNFAGGDGTNYYASLTTYADAGAAMAGAVSTTPASTYNYNNQPNGTRYIKIVSGSISTPKQIGQTFNFNASYTELVGYIYTCNRGVTSTAVYRNTNTCFFGNQWISGTTTYASNPSQTAPNTTANWVNNGAAYCGGDCIAYQPQIDNNACSSTYGDTRNVSLGQTAPCNYTPNWVDRDINTYWVCVGVNKYYQQIDLGGTCSPTYGQTRTGSIYQPNSLDCGYVPPTTTTTTLAPVNCSISSVCDGAFQDITISGFTGGNGSYLASTTTYDSASNAFNGSFEAVSGSKFYNNQPGNSERFIVLKDTEGRSVLKSINAGCTTTAAPTTAAPVYNYYEFTDCGSGTTILRRSTSSFGLGEVYTFQPGPTQRVCWIVTNINAAENSNDILSIFGPHSGCTASACIPQ
jgi:hypothetical protein